MEMGGEEVGDGLPRAGCAKNPRIAHFAVSLGVGWTTCKFPNGSGGWQGTGSGRHFCIWKPSGYSSFQV